MAFAVAGAVLSFCCVCFLLFFVLLVIFCYLFFERANTSARESFKLQTLHYARVMLLGAERLLRFES